jgi:hypothetical protein
MIILGLEFVKTLDKNYLMDSLLAKKCLEFVKTNDLKI